MNLPATGAGFRLSAICALRSIRRLFTRTVVIDHEVLAQCYQVRGDPVHEQSGGEVEEEYSKAYRKKAHKPALLRVNVLGGYLRGRQHRYRRDDRQEVCGIGYREVLEP